MARRSASAAPALRALLAAALVCVSLAVPSPQRRPAPPGSGGRWKMLGARCDADRDCAVPYSRCVAQACACQPYYARYNESRCLPSTLLGFECVVREQCSLKVANSSCIHGLCRCEPGFLQFRRHTCLSPAKPGDVCYSDAHCRLWDANSHCHFLIPKLFGRCGCNAHMVPHGSACVPSQEEEFPPEAPADPSTRQPPPSTTTTTTTTTTTAAPTTTTTTTTPTTTTTTTTPTTTTTTTAPTTTKTEAPYTLSHTSTPAAITSTTDGISAPSTTAAASMTQSHEATSATSATDEVWPSAAPPSESVEPLAVSFSTGEDAAVTGNETDVSIKYPVPSSYPWSTTEDPYRDVTAEVEAETSPLMADATSPPVSSTQPDQPDVLSSSALPAEATENTLGSSEGPIDASSQSKPTGDESDSVASPTTQSTSNDALTYSPPKAQWTTPKSESYSEDSIEGSSPISIDFVDSQASLTTEATAPVPSHPPPFSVGTELTFDANYATSTDNQPSLSSDDSWISSSSAYFDPASTTQDTSVSTDDAWISSSAVPNPVVTTTGGSETVTSDAEIASPSTEVATPTQETPGSSSAEPILQDDTEDISEELVPVEAEPSDTTDKQPTVEGVPAASESVPTLASPSASIVQVTSATERVEPSDTTNQQSSVQGLSVASESVPTSSSSSAPLVQVTSAEKHSTEEDMMLSATSFSAGVWPRAVSLGLACVSDLQCQAADPHSRCVDGACDCVHRANGSASCWAGNRGCHPNTFQCRSSGACISWFFVCDGRRDCADGSDEECSGSDPGGCPPLSLRCSSDGRCVSRAARCDGNTDCAMGEDEQGCSQRSACPQFTFACLAGGNASCLPDYELCNAVVSCADGSDEPRWCRVPPPGAATGHRLRMRARARARTGPRCPFRCDNGRCRSTAILCSGRDGCGDASDEARCSVCKCAPASD